MIPVSDITDALVQAIQQAIDPLTVGEAREVLQSIHATAANGLIDLQTEDYGDAPHICVARLDGTPDDIIYVDPSNPEFYKGWLTALFTEGLISHEEDERQRAAIDQIVQDAGYVIGEEEEVSRGGAECAENNFGWTACEDGLPSRGEIVAAFDNRNAIRGPFSALYNGELWADGNGIVCEHPTHWAPMEMMPSPRSLKEAQS